MNLDFLKPLIAGWLRHLLTTCAGALIADGYLQSSQEQQFIGAALTLLVMLWSAAQKFYANQKLEAAKASIPAGAYAIGTDGKFIPGATIKPPVPTAILNHQ